MKKYILSIALFSAFASFGQLDRSIIPKPSAAPVINIAKPVTFDLKNGIKVIVSENHKQPKVAFNLVMGGNPVSEGNKAGMVSMLSALMNSGTDNRTKDQLDNEKDFIGAYLSASGSDVYLSCLTKHLNKGLDLMLDVTMHPSFPESEFDRIKAQNESGLLSTQSNPGAMASNAQSKALFPNHPYGDVMTEASLNNISRIDVVELYKQRFTPQGAYLVIVGDITPAKAKQIATERFGSWKGAALPATKDLSNGYFPKGNRVIFVEKPGAVQSVITVAQPLNIKPGDKDQITLSVMNKILGGGGFGTRLMANLREDKAYTYGAYSAVDVDRFGSSISASGNFRNEVTDSAIVELLYEFDRITKGEVTDEELNLNKSAMAGSFARSLESPQTIARFALSTYRNGLDADYYQTYLKKLSTVNKKNVLDVAKKYVNPNGLDIIVVGDIEVLEKLKKFDADGNIEMFDAFGNPAVKVEYKKADISKEQLIQDHLIALTSAKNYKKALKTLNKVKTYHMVLKMQPVGAPVELDMNIYYVKPGKTMSTMEYGGMVMNKRYFDGKTGGSQQMSQTGMVKSENSAEEIKKKQLFNTIVPEMILADGKVNFELLGMIEENGSTYYVIQYDGEDGLTTSYYDSKTKLKMKTVTITESEQGSLEATANFSDYRAVKKVMFPYLIKQVVGPQAIDGKIESLKVNTKVDLDMFKL